MEPKKIQVNSRKTQNTAKFGRNLIKYLSVQYIWNLSQLLGCLLAVNLQIYLETSSLKRANNVPKLHGVDCVAKNWALVMMLKALPLVLFSGLLIFRRKKRKISRDLQGQIRGRIGRFRGIFAGKKSKFAEKLAVFAGESQNSQKNRPISRVLAEKSQILKDFQGQVLRKIGQFHGKFRGETSSRNN